ncbi:CAP domain-containing protein [Butyrivibrio sp. XPD2002]|uniref:CAP domain-containing protein n=1 Tax=Butyrivibrio sp. XPD2002 TaxID=1280665 RepID=UPI0004057792|nr:CAP domain-containing protein [Butyrivibrio sp. XPD2002]
MKWGKGKFKRTVIVSLFSLVMLCGVKVDTHAAGTTTYNVTGKYDQTSARSMLSTINAYRTGGKAWIRDTSNNKKSLGKLNALQWDYNLEIIAMQRAMEISVRADLDHKRPNNTSYYTYTYSGTKTNGENIYGISRASGAQEAYEQWMEENEPYSGQGHRRNMLNSGYTSIGIAHVVRNGHHFWVQEFGHSNSNASKTNAVNDYKTLSIEVLNGFLHSYLRDADDWDSIEIMYGETFDLGEITEYITAETTTEGLDIDFPIEPLEPPIATRRPTNWTVTNSKIAAVSGNKLTANKIGTTSITTKSALGKTLSMPLTVTACRIGYTSINLDKYDYEYTGKPITPNIKITYAGKTLKQGTDYTVSYSNNTNPGTAKATITGKGNFTGTTTRSFYIRKKASDIEPQNPSEGEGGSENVWEESKDTEEKQPENQTADKLLDDGKSCIIGNVIYVINGNDAEVSGCTGDIASYTAPKYVTISGREYRVSSIGSDAFKKIKTLKKVDLSKSEIETIGSGAFSGDSNLKNIKLKASTLKKVNKNAFKKISSKAKCTIKAKDKKAYDKLVKKVKKAGMKKATFKMKK